MLEFLNIGRNDSTTMKSYSYSNRFLLDGEELVERYLLRLLFLVVFSLMVIHAGPPLKSDGRVIGIVSARCTEKEIEFISSFFFWIFLTIPINTQFVSPPFICFPSIFLSYLFGFFTWYLAPPSAS